MTRQNSQRNNTPEEKCVESSDFHKEKCVEGLLFPKEEWRSLVKWSPVSNIDEIYKDLPEAKEYHKSYVNFWLSKNR